MSESIRVLVADDNIQIRSLVVRILEPTEFHVIAVTSTGAETLEMARKSSPDLILLDRGLPDDRDLATLVNLRQECPSTRILMFSGDGNPYHVQRAMDLGASGYVIKGVSAVNLVRFLRAAASGKIVTESV